MKLFASTFSSVAAPCASLLLIAHCCAAAGDTPGTSTSGASTSASRVSRAGITAGGYKDAYLDARTIAALTPHSVPAPDELPFYGLVPLYSVDTAPATVSQALRDNQQVGIVDKRRRQAVLIQYYNGGLSQQDFADTQAVVKTFSSDPNLHRLKAAIWGRAPPPRPEDIDGLPHSQGKPILTLNEQSVGAMYAASTRDQNAFWFALPRKQYLLVHPYQQPFFEDVDRRTAKAITQVRDNFESLRQSHGRGLAGLKYGRPLHLDPELVQTLPETATITSYHRLGSNEATRQQMLAALREHGRFRLYLNHIGHGQSRDRFNVILDRASSSRQQSPFDLVIAPMTKSEIRKEASWGMPIPLQDLSKVPK